MEEWEKYYVDTISYLEMRWHMKPCHGIMYFSGIWGQKRHRTVCTILQSYQGLWGLLTELLDTVKYTQEPLPKWVHYSSGGKIHTMMKLEWQAPMKATIWVRIWPQGCKTFFMLNSAAHEICPGNISQITNNCELFFAKHSWAWKFLC